MSITGELDLKSKRGRPRKPGDRYPSGQLKSKHVTAEDRRAMAPLLWQRLREDGIRLGLDPRLHSVIGKMSLHGILTDAQAAVADHIGEVIGRWERLEGLPARSARSPAYDRGFGSASNGSDGLGDHVRRVARARKAAERIYALIPMRVSPDGEIVNSPAKDAIQKVCVENEEIPSSQHDDLAKLLTIIGQKIGMIGGAMKQYDVARPRDVAALANQAVESIHRYFADRAATPISFEVDTALAFDQPRSIIVVGQSKFKAAEIRKSVDVACLERSVVGASSLDAALIAAAEKRGWRGA